MEPVNLNQIQNTMQTGSRIREQAARQIRPEADNAADRAAKTSREQDNAAKRAQEMQSKSSAQAEDSAAKGIYGDVLDISEDGDTVTARPEALKKLDDGIVMLRSDAEEDKKSVAEEEDEAAEKRADIRAELEAKAEASKEAREELAEARSEKAEEKADNASYDSLKGYSDDMVNTLYRQGKIDSRSYNTEMERRARLDEELTPDKKEDDKEDVQNAIENNNGFARDMGELRAQAEEDELESEALITAAENGRIDIMKDILDGTSN